MGGDNEKITRSYFQVAPKIQPQCPSPWWQVPVYLISHLDALVEIKPNYEELGLDLI